MRTWLFGLMVAMSLLSACSKKGDACPENTLVAPASEEQLVKAYLDSNDINATRYKSNLYYEVVSAGSGGSPNACSTIQVKYRGMLTDGTVFDESDNFIYQLNSLIAGWIQGIPLVQKGGSIRLFIPPSLGYGATPVTDPNGAVRIPANSVLIFDITLVDFE